MELNGKPLEGEWPTIVRTQRFRQEPGLRKIDL
jgi:hypothetical protein